MKKNAEELHNDAMKLLDEALIAKVNGEIEREVELFKLAYEKEREAAFAVPEIEDGNLELSKIILLKSAACIAYDLGKFGEARELAYLGLSKSPPQWLRVELESMSELIEIKK